MNIYLKNALVVILGIVVGAIVNMAIIMLGPSIIPLPEGIDPADVESLKANIHLFKPINFVVPFLAHALGTLVGAYLVAKYAEKIKLPLAMVIGFVFLAGGIQMVMDLGGPTWFSVLDLAGAYLPMAWLGHKLAAK